MPVRYRLYLTGMSFCLATGNKNFVLPFKTWTLSYQTKLMMRQLYSILLTISTICAGQITSISAQTHEALQVLMLDVSTYDAYYSEQIQGALMAIDPRIGVSNFTDANQDLSQSLVGKDIVIVAYPHKGNTQKLRAYGTTLQQFAQQGGLVVFTGTHEISKLNLYNLIQCDRGSYNPAPFVRLIQRALFTQNLPAEFSTSNFSYPVVINDANYVSLAQDGDRTVYGYKKYGVGTVFYVGLEFYHIDQINRTILENILAFAKNCKQQTATQVNHTAAVVTESRNLPINYTTKVDWTVFPNPYVSRTQAEFTVTQTSRVDLSIYDEAGRTRQRLIQNVIYEPGQYVVEIADLPQGTYFVQLRIGDFRSLKKIVRVPMP